MNPALNFRCIVVRSESIGDWWTIQRAEHDGREWERPVKYGIAWTVSARLGEGDNNYDIEGRGVEMLALAAAIESRGEASFTRCSAVTTTRGVDLESPRNSRHPVTISQERADELAADIRAKVAYPVTT